MKTQQSKYGSQHSFLDPDYKGTTSTKRKTETSQFQENQNVHTLSFNLRQNTLTESAFNQIRPSAQQSIPNRDHSVNKLDTTMIEGELSYNKINNSAVSGNQLPEVIDEQGGTSSKMVKFKTAKHKLNLRKETSTATTSLVSKPQAKQPSDPHQPSFVTRGTIKRLNKSILRAPVEMRKDTDQFMLTCLEREGYHFNQTYSTFESSFKSKKRGTKSHNTSASKLVKETLLNSTQGSLQLLLLPKGPSLRRYAEDVSESDSKRKLLHNQSISGTNQGDQLPIDKQSSPSLGNMDKLKGSPLRANQAAPVFQYQNVLAFGDTKDPNGLNNSEKPGVKGQTQVMLGGGTSQRTAMSLFDHKYRLKSTPGVPEITQGSNKHITSQVESQSDVLTNQRLRQPLYQMPSGDQVGSSVTAQLDTHDEFYYRNSKYFVPFDTIHEPRPVLMERPVSPSEPPEEKFRYSPNKGGISAFGQPAKEPFSFKDLPSEKSNINKFKRAASLLLVVNKVGSKSKLEEQAQPDGAVAKQITSVADQAQVGRSVSQPQQKYFTKEVYEGDSPGHIKLTSKQLQKLLLHNKKTMKDIEKAGIYASATKKAMLEVRQEQFYNKIDTVTKRLKVKSMAGTTLFAHGKFITQETEASNQNAADHNAIPDIPINEIIDAIEIDKIQSRPLARSQSGNILEGDLDQQNEASSESRLPYLKKSASNGAGMNATVTGLDSPKKLYSLDDLRNPTDFECAFRYLPLSSHNTNSSKPLPPSRERACSVMFGSQSSNSIDVAGNGAKIVMFGGLGSECFSDMCSNTCIGLPTLNQNAHSTYTPSWTSVAAEAGSLVSRFESTMNLYNGSTFVLFGGKSNKGRTYTVRTNDLFVLSDQKWNRIAWEDDAPIPRSSHASVIIGDWLIVFGGTNQDDELLFDGFAVKLTGIDKKNRTSMSYLTIKNETSINGLSHHQMCLVADPEDTRQILIPFHKVDKLKPRTARGGAEKAIYVFGGMCSNTGAGSRELYMIKVFASTFVFKKVETVGKKPKPRVGHSMHYVPKIESLVVLFGRDPTTREYLNSLSMISLINMSWYKVKLVSHSLVASGRAFHCSHVDERAGRIFIFGGVNDTGFLPSAIDSFQMVPILKPKPSPQKKSPLKISIPKQN